MAPRRRPGAPGSEGAGPGWSTPNYLSFVLRVQLDGEDTEAPGVARERSVRVEFVNGNEVKHFNGLEPALQFIWEMVAVRREQP